MLLAWKANLDIQFVLDTYACAAYVAAYVSKSMRGISEILRQVSDEVQQGNLDLKKQMSLLGNKFLNAVEISIQESVYICLHLRMRQSSRQVVFVNTSPADQRVSMLKNQEHLDKLDDESSDIFCENDIIRYAKRPLSMKDVT